MRRMNRRQVIDALREKLLTLVDDQTLAKFYRDFCGEAIEIEPAPAATTS